MRFTTFVFKNLRRRPLRSVLTIFSIAVAIGAAVALVGISNGFEQTFMALYKNAGINMVVVRAGEGRHRINGLPINMRPMIEQVPGVKEVLCGMVDMVSYSDLGLFNVVVNGWEPETAIFNHLTVLDGRKLQKDDKKALMLGTLMAGNLGKKVGDTFEVVEGEVYKIVGIYESNNTFENGAIILSLPELQRIMGRPGRVTSFALILERPDDQAGVKQIRKEIEALDITQEGGHVKAWPSDEFIKSINEIQMAKAMSFLTSSIALFIGLFGITNTMVMSVNERTREIGILRAVGWQTPRIVRMVMVEAVLLGIMGAIVGMIGATVIVQLLTRVPTVNGLISGKIEPIYLAYGFLIAVILGLVGSILPAFRATRMMPTEALRHE